MGNEYFAFWSAPQSGHFTHRNNIVKYKVGIAARRKGRHDVAGDAARRGDGPAAAVLNKDGQSW